MPHPDPPTASSRMTGLHVGMDIDGVLADYTSGLVTAARRLGHPMDGADCGPGTYSMVERGWFPDEAALVDSMRELASFSGLGALALLDAGAPAAMRRLRDAGHRVTIVTARHPGTPLQRRPRQIPYRLAYRGIQDTLDWLDEYGFEFDDIRFTRDKPSIGADVYLDDAPHNVIEIRDAGLIAVVRDATYNQDVDGPRAGSVAEFADMVLSGALHNAAA